MKSLRKNGKKFLQERNKWLEILKKKLNLMKITNRDARRCSLRLAKTRICNKDHLIKFAPKATAIDIQKGKQNIVVQLKNH